MMIWRTGNTKPLLTYYVYRFLPEAPATDFLDLILLRNQVFFLPGRLNRVTVSAFLVNEGGINR